MYEAKQCKEKASRQIDVGGGGRQQRHTNNTKYTDIIQRQLTSLNEDGESLLGVYNYESDQNKNADLTLINNKNYEEIQVVYSNKGFVIYGKIQENDLPDDKAIIIGVKTRIIDKYNNRDAKNPFYESDKNPVYYDTTNTKSAEIAFSNKMSLRGYLILEEEETDRLGMQVITPVPMEKKGKGLSIMNNKPWYYPTGGNHIKYSKYNIGEARENIQLWRSFENAPFITEKVRRIEFLIANYRPNIPTAYNESAEGSNNTFDLNKLLKEKGVLADDLRWAVKDENSLKKRLYHKRSDELIKIERSKIENKIKVYDEQNNYVRPRDMNELENKIITRIEGNNSEYKWSVTSIDELGERYALIEEQRSNKEWLEVLHLWEQSMGIEGIVMNWKKTAGLHLDSSGLESMETETNTVRSEENVDLFNKLKNFNFIEGDGTWVVKTIRDLGDKYASLGEDKQQLEWNDVLKAWNETHHTKVAYNLDEKFNNWTQGTTEWGVNSTTNIGASNETPFAGWSKFEYSQEPGEIVNFHGIRGAEIPHKHPIQTEIYKVNSGTAFLMVEGSIKKVEKNHNEIIKPMREHCIVAIRSPYEHIVIQSPSGFHHKQNKIQTKDSSEMDSLFNTVVEMENPSATAETSSTGQ